MLYIKRATFQVIPSLIHILKHIHVIYQTCHISSYTKPYPYIKTYQYSQNFIITWIVIVYATIQNAREEERLVGLTSGPMPYSHALTNRLSQCVTRICNISLIVGADIWGSKRVRCLWPTTQKPSF